MSLRVRCLFVLGALALFLVLMVASAAVYPGGTYHDRTYPRHHFWYNYLCDLLHEHSLGGGRNVLGARLATAGMLLLVVLMAVYWTLAPAFLPSRPGLGRVCSVVGIISSVGLVAVALTPSDRLPKFHTAAIVLATLPGLVAATAIIVGRTFEPDVTVSVRVLGAATLLFVVATAGVFVVHTWFGGGFGRALPACQRIAALCTVAWLGTTTFVLLRSGA